QERWRTLSARWQVARLSQSHRRQRVGGAHRGFAAKQLLRQRAARRDGDRSTRFVWRLLWHYWRSGLWIRRRWRQLGADRSRSSGRAFSGGPDADMIRVALPLHLRTLAGVNGDVELDVAGEVTRGLVLDALEERYPMLRGTIRDHVGGQRRPFLRFFACGEDITHEPADAPLPQAIASGAETFYVIGAIAGG